MVSFCSTVRSVEQRNGANNTFMLKEVSEGKKVKTTLKKGGDAGKEGFGLK